MLRIEQGFDDSLFDTSNKSLKGYTNHHRLLVPALAAYDLIGANSSKIASIKKVHHVMNGDIRSATLAYEGDNVREAARNIGWIAIRDDLMIDEEHTSAWRITSRDDTHMYYPDAKVWSATRNLVKLPENASDECSTRVRERYTLTALDRVGENDIRAILEENEAPDDVMIATATVYAINKTVAKPHLPREAIDSSKYPMIAQQLAARY